MRALPLLLLALTCCSEPAPFPEDLEAEQVLIFRRATTCVEQPDIGAGTAEVEIGYRPVVLQHWAPVRGSEGEYEPGSIVRIMDGIATVEPCGGYVTYTVAARDVQR